MTVEKFFLNVPCLRALVSYQLSEPSPTDNDNIPVLVIFHTSQPQFNLNSTKLGFDMIIFVITPPQQ